MLRLMVKLVLYLVQSLAIDPLDTYQTILHLHVDLISNVQVRLETTSCAIILISLIAVYRVRIVVTVRLAL